MEPLQLKDCLGEKSEFYLSKPDRIFHLKEFTLADKKWTMEKYGESIDYSKVSYDKLCEIAYHMMELEDQAYFEPVEQKFRNDLGEIFTKRLGGVELMFWYVAPAEQEAIYTAVMKSMVGSKAINYVTNENEKKRLEIEKQTGQKSSTSSPTSMDGLHKKSFNARKKRSLSESMRLEKGTS